MPIPREQLVTSAVTFADTTTTKVGTGGSFTVTGQTAVGFNPGLAVSDLIVNGRKASADLTEAVTSVTLTRSITAASTITIVVEDPTRALVRSNIAQISAPAEPTNVSTTTVTTTPNAQVAPLLKSGLALAAQDPIDAQVSTSTTLKVSKEAYFPTTVKLTDGTTTLTFALVEIDKSGNTVTLTFEDILINQLRYCFNPTGYTAQDQTMTRAQIMAKVVQLALASLKGNKVAPKLIYPPTSVVGAVVDKTTLTWGTATNPDEDAWSFLVQAANSAQWRCFSTGTALVFGPDGWLLSKPVAATFREWTGAVGNIDFNFDIGKAEASATVNLTTGDSLAFAPGSVCRVDELGVCDGLWVASEMARELHQPDCTVQLAQPQPALTESQIAATDGSTAVGSGTNAAGQSLVTAGNIGGTAAGETSIAAAAITYAIAQVGKPYGWGQTGPASFDCSGLMLAAYRAAGLLIPRTSEAQYAGLPAVPLSTLIPGDLIFYEGVPPGHVVLYIGNGQTVQAPHTGANVFIGPIDAGAVGAARPSGAT